ncbi:MAG: DNA mismatch repair endonuclease MutL, partial [Pseudomonadota bacterium]|nr:DNA mismatch repair endonuclease MutL [Pseudomonadota bacterium]
MPMIRELPDILINQISAGEVVDRPASALKELLENSLDAGASRIDVVLREGGIDQICVHDNGVGIDSSDLPLALSRHATSKIVSPADLENITSMGFRGEALASIASVSHLVLVSRTAADSHAYMIEGKGGVVSSVRPAALASGTRIEVSDIYFNTPARKKFLRGASTEFGHGKTVFLRVALSRPDVSFSLVHNQKLQVKLSVSKDALADRVREVLGQDFFDESLEINETVGGMRIYGFIARPTYSKARRDGQYIYVNGRFVRDKLIIHALRQAYADVLHHDCYPVYVLYLTLPYDQV